jgi:hypothetical protein
MGKRKLTTEEFITKAKQVHGDRYDYSQVEYINTKTKVIIICPEHGPFEQRPDNHINRKSGCPSCVGKNPYTTESFITKAKQVHGNRYDYSQVKYVNSHTKIVIICPEHGPFEQRPYHHLRGVSCFGCDGSEKFTLSGFTEKSIQTHGNRYDYSQVKYVNNRTKVTIICPEHGPFEQTPYSHIRGCRCPICAKHVSNQELDLLGLILDIYDGEVITNSRSVISPYEVDIYLPDKKMAFEYNGDFWHLEGVNKPIGYHQMKTDMCRERDIILYHIWEDDWINNNDHIKNMIKELLL